MSGFLNIQNHRGVGKNLHIIDQIFLRLVTTTTWTETCNTIQCAVSKICLYFCLISCFSVALRNRTCQTQCDFLAPLVFNPHRLKSHNYRLRSTVHAMNGILVVKLENRWLDEIPSGFCPKMLQISAWHQRNLAAPGPSHFPRGYAERIILQIAATTLQDRD